MTVVKENCGQKPGGWTPDVPDPRDFTLSCAPRALRKAVGLTRARQSQVDLRDFFPAVEDQGQTSATSAYACGGLIEYFNQRCRGKLSLVSKTFLYDATRRLHGLPDGSSMSLRQVWRTLVRVGVPPASCVSRPAAPWQELTLDPLLYMFAREYAEIRYFRVAPLGNRDMLSVIKSVLYLGLPCVFGMPLFNTITTDPRVDYHPRVGEVVGGTSGVLVGFDDNYRISSRGAFLFRSSWGPAWGECGYGWLTYQLVSAAMIRDVWTVFNPAWLDTDDFAFRECSRDGSTRSTRPP